jgi:hypothetical protein
VKVNGLRADDLAGTGLITKQRWAIPLALGVTLAAIAFLYRRLLRLVAVLARCWRGTAPAALLAAGYLRHGELGFAVVLAMLATVGGVWWWRWPISFMRHVVHRAYGAVRWHSVYRRGWAVAMDACGLAWVSRDRVLFVPRVDAVHSTRVVDVLDVRLLHGQTPEQVGEQAEALRHVFGAHRCKVNETAPGRVKVTFYARDPLTAPLPPIPPQPQPDLKALPVGRSEDGTVFCLRLLGRHTLVAGASGAGKGSALWSPILAMAPLIRAGVVELHGIDPKRMELVFAPELFTKLTAGTPADAAGHLEELAAPTPTPRPARRSGRRCSSPSPWAAMARSAATTTPPSTPAGTTTCGPPETRCISASCWTGGRRTCAGSPATRRSTSPPSNRRTGPPRTPTSPSAAPSPELSSGS